MRFRVATVMIFASCALGLGPANGQQTAPPPVTNTVPFPSARGLAALRIAIGGFQGSHQRIAAGDRMFGICWLGGKAPFKVTLRDGSGAEVINETGLNGQYLIKASQPVHFEPQDYAISISDAAGHGVTGTFTAVGADAMPTVPPAIRQAGPAERSQWLAKQNADFAYEAYLSLLPQTISGGNRDARSLVDNICGAT